MFGMSSEDFWENDPKLYWAYRTFYLEKLRLDAEKEKYNAWLQGSTTYMAVSIALNNAFSKQKTKFPSYEEMFNDKTKIKENKQLTKEEIQQQAINEFNAWARY